MADPARGPVRVRARPAVKLTGQRPGDRELARAQAAAPDAPRSDDLVPAQGADHGGRWSWRSVVLREPGSRRRPLEPGPQQPALL